MILDTIQILVSVFVDVLIVFSAGSIASFMNRKPMSAQVQKWMMGMVLSALAARLLGDGKKLKIREPQFPTYFRLALNPLIDFPS